ncbi:MAG: hypothetical protein PWQ10_49 [Patescibacteria group bacterium]|nr:hypothetical protein [Patescibacteria group bacterium]
MRKLLSLVRKAPKRTSAALLMIATAVIVPAVLFAWGPERPTYTIEVPADHVTFNSITNNPNYGDERNFVTIKDADNTAKGGWTDDITIQNGKEYYVRMYVHNNAAANLNLVAENVVANFNVPTQTAKRIQIDGYISSSNAKPDKIWDQAVFSSDSDFNMTYVAGSATYTNNVFTAGTALPDTVVSSGATLGYDKLDGKIPGCYKYDGLVIFKVKATTASFDVQKTVRANSATDKTFKESVNVKPGDKVDYQIYFKNTGGTQLKDVVIKDTLPAGAKYVAGSTYLHNSDGTKQVADGITAGGIVIGGYMPEGDAYIKFTAEIPNNDALPACGPNTLINTAKAITSGGAKEDTANVVVTKECEAPTVAYTCDALSIIRLSKTSTRFKLAYSVDNATFKSVTYVIRDADDKIIDTKTSTDTTFDYDQSTVGKYTVQATITVEADGKDATATSTGCKAAFEITGEEPTTPTELPKTGATVLASVIGLGTLITSLGYYINSRRAL